MKRYCSIIFACLALFVVDASLHGDDAAPRDWKAPPYACRKKNPISADDKSIAAGKDVYESQCLCCHGDCNAVEHQRTGEGQPPDLRDREIQDQTDGAIFWKISRGHSPMPAFGTLLPDENDRWNVVNYIRTLAPRPTTEPATQPFKGE